MARFSMFTLNRLSLKTFNEKPLFGFSTTTLMIDLGDNRYDIYCELSANDSYEILCLIFLISSKHYFPAAKFFICCRI